MSIHSITQRQRRLPWSRLHCKTDACALTTCVTNHCLSHAAPFPAVSSVRLQVRTKVRHDSSIGEDSMVLLRRLRMCTMLSFTAARQFLALVEGSTFVPFHGFCMTSFPTVQPFGIFRPQNVHFYCPCKPAAFVWILSRYQAAAETTSLKACRGGTACSA